MRISHQRLEEALYNMGLVYRNDLVDVNEAIACFEEVIERYPEGDYGLMAAYNLYEIHGQEGRTSRSTEYKNYIIQNYPDSPRAKILSDPEYVNQLLEEQNRVNRFYEEVYDAFQRENFSKVVQDSEYALKEFKGDKLIPRFKLLRALSLGRQGGDDVMSEELGKLIEEYPEHEITSFARDVIASLYQATPELEIEDTREEAEEIYAFNSDTTHVFGILCNSTELANQLNFNLINFHLDNFPRQNLGIEQTEIGDNNFFIIRSFASLENIRRYYSVFNSNEDVIYNDVDRNRVVPFMISIENLETLEGDLDFKKYRLYFEKYYLE
jgi:tetratricopeptide (TPR) repeat protein